MYPSKYLHTSFARRVSVAVSTVAVSAFLFFQASPVLAQTGSSSGDYVKLLDLDTVLDGAAGGSAALSGPVNSLAAAGPQYGRPSQYPTRGLKNHIAIEGGGGFTVPVGNSQRDLDYGWNFTGGLGYKFSPNFSMMAEYQFIRNGIPGSILALVGEPGGDVHTWSLTLDPVLYYKTTGTWGGYFTGGGGFYRKLTSFTEPALAYGEYCDYFSCYPYEYAVNAVVSHYSSNQGGANIGTGITFGRWAGAKLYAEARYTWLDTPGRSTQVVPVTFGFRW